MMEDRANELFEDAIKKLNEADQELCRPEEDVVSFSVCKKAQFAVENYLKGFLLQNGVDISNYNSIDVLYDQCRAVNKNFEKIDLSSFICKSHELDSSHCNGLSKVSSCFDTASALDTFLRQEKIIN